jgi:hypothetical protein
MLSIRICGRDKPFGDVKSSLFPEHMVGDLGENGFLDELVLGIRRDGSWRRCSRVFGCGIALRSGQ